MKIDNNRFTQVMLNVVAGGLIAAAPGFGIFARERNSQAQLALIMGALPISLVAAYFGHLADEVEPYQRMRVAANHEIFAGQLANEIESCQSPSPAPQLLPSPSPVAVEEGQAIATTSLESVLSTGTGIALLGNSGSGKSSIVQWLIGEAQPESLVILDPHNDGKVWGDLPVIDEYDLILEKLAELLEELKSRRDRRKKGLPNFPLMIVADEWASLRAYASRRKNDICDEFVLLMGCEARKLNMVTLLCSHSGNVKAMGLEGQGDFLENWCLVRLGKIAKKYAKNMPDRLVADAVTKSAYPCIINDELSYHPTHGCYTVFADGNAPKNIKPYLKHQSSSNQGIVGSRPISDPAKSEADVIKKYLESLYKIPGYQPTHPQSPGQSLDHSESPIESPGVTQSEQGLQSSGVPGDLPFSKAAKEGYPAFVLGSRSLLLVVQALKSEGQNQEQIIRFLWGLPKNGKQRYKDAVMEFKQLIGE